MSGAKYLLSNDSTELVLDILTNPEYQRMSGQELEEIASDFINNDPALSSAMEEQIGEMLTQQLRAILKESGKQSLPMSSKQGETYVYFTITSENGKFKLKLDSNLKPAHKTQIKKAFELLLKENTEAQNKFSDATRNALMI
jgi:L-lactate utilization protein LutC